MEQSPDNSRILTLPVELLVHIISFLADVRDKAKLRYVSRRLREVSETPSLWRKFIWPYYNSNEERCLCRLMKVCGKHIVQLSFPHHVMPSKLVKFLQYCGNVRHLSLPHVTKFSFEQLTKILQHMECLSVLKVRLSVGISSLLQLTLNVEDLTLYIRDRNLDDSCFHMLHEWVVNENAPKNLNVVTLPYYEHYMYSLIHSWSQWNADMLVSRTLCLRLHVYINMHLALNYSYSLPVLQLQYGQKSHLPLVKASRFGLLGLRNDLLLLTDCTYQSETFYRAMPLSLHHFNSPFNSSITDLAFVTYFDIGPSEGGLYSGHLEQLALACPNLMWLNLWGNSQCLRSLQGLEVISRCCQKLQGLKVLDVTCRDIQNQVKLWDILSSMKLTQLAVELCTLKPLCECDTNELIRRYQRCSSLQVLELDANCKDCRGNFDECPLLLANFPLLECCRVLSIHSLNANEIITTCRGLKIFKCGCTRYLTLSSAHNCNLEQLCIASEGTDVDVTFLDTVSAHGGLVHVYLSVNSASSEGITSLIENSPKLLTCDISTYRQIYDNEGVQVNVKHLKATLKTKFSHRKLFTCSQLQLVQDLNDAPYSDDCFENVDFILLNVDNHD